MAMEYLVGENSDKNCRGIRDQMRVSDETHSRWGSSKGAGGGVVTKLKRSIKMKDGIEVSKRESTLPSLIVDCCSPKF
jgi:hypothetical protein